MSMHSTHQDRRVLCRLDQTQDADVQQCVNHCKEKGKICHSTLMRIIIDISRLSFSATDLLYVLLFCVNRHQD
jgi:hypothetical protein